MGRAAESGITTLYLASAYHAGFFLQSHNPVHKLCLVEDGSVYFHPRAEVYGSVKPAVAQIAAETDWFEAVSKRLERFSLRLSAWTVCMHNSRIGEAHPDLAVEDAFSNLHPYALCPSHPDVRRYIRALISDLTRYSLTSILLEAFRYLDVVHGCHHERWSIPLPPLERSLLGLSFCPTDMKAAGDVGIDSNHVRKEVKAHLERFFLSYPKLPRKFPRRQEEFDFQLPELKAYRECLVSTMDSLLSEVVTDLGSNSLDLIGQGQQEFNITCSPSHHGFAALLRPGNDDAPRITRRNLRLDKQAACAGRKIYATIRLGFDAVKSCAELKRTIQTAIDAGADGLVFNNYAECPETVFRWLAQVSPSPADH